MAPDDRSPAEATRESRAKAAALYQRYSEGLLAFFRSSLPLSRDDATDLLNQVFVELLRWLDNNPGVAIERPQAFLFTLARRHLGKHIDKLRRTPSAPANARGLDDFEPSPDARAYDQEFLACAGEGRRMLLRAMRRLTIPEDSPHLFSELQQVTYLKFWVGMTEAQISEVLEISRSAVTRRLTRAKKELRERLLELEDAEPGSTRTSTTILERWWKGFRSGGEDVASSRCSAESDVDGEERTTSSLESAKGWVAG